MFFYIKILKLKKKSCETLYLTLWNYHYRVEQEIEKELLIFFYQLQARINTVTAK